MALDRNPKHNGEGYPDPTAYNAIKTVRKQETLERERDIGRLMEHIKWITDLAGFELGSRIVFKDKKTGRIYK
ncbi:MAG: hypothetical protein MJ117_00120 [Lachnospiraceae bacterium]|nr:hypothetical protein [Lachnospiraceae bacterium]